MMAFQLRVESVRTTSVWDNMEAEHQSIKTLEQLFAQSIKHSSLWRNNSTGTGLRRQPMKKELTLFAVLDSSKPVLNLMDG